MHTVAVLLLPGFVGFDMSIPSEIFSRAHVKGLDQPYRVFLCGETRRVRNEQFCAEIDRNLDTLAEADTIIVPGVNDPHSPVSRRVIAALCDAASRGARVASICTGAFVLAAAGLLDGRRATTHWLAAEELARCYPAVDVDPTVLFVDEGKILTSAGAAAGMDLCLHMIQQDYGVLPAVHAARLAVVPLARDGGQAQFIRHDGMTASAWLQPLLKWMRRHLKEPLTISAIAHRARTSTRTLSRRFLAETGMSPLQWLLAARVRRAQELLETTAWSIEQIAYEAGFGSATALRENFRRITGTAPARYRKTFSAPSSY
ncbi:GlxA family transcriptional regulator [Paraburkholderia caribensis]|uniref:GlxA family transcriptional regulator n=1 Tax=Paraburkholderia caribensis TaxID=75105 RepID=UPI00078BA058|nr:helix-turn-helix domain-containing protein [Paraburkholderia caribensis]AMV48303.1 AraC family transcriptional regulator [Paraburkholderia caribensis]